MHTLEENNESLASQNNVVLFDKKKIKLINAGEDFLFFPQKMDGRASIGGKGSLSTRIVKKK